MTPALLLGAAALSVGILLAFRTHRDNPKTLAGTILALVLVAAAFTALMLWPHLSGR